MITHMEREVAGVRYYLRFKGESLGTAPSAREAMAAVDRNPGMIVEAEVWNLVNAEYGVEETQPRRVVYPASGHSATLAA